MIDTLIRDIKINTIYKKTKQNKNKNTKIKTGKIISIDLKVISRWIYNGYKFGWL